MAKKTNKTSHVMDLLTNGASGDSSQSNDSVAPDTAAAGQDKKNDVQSHSVTPKKVTVVDEGSRNDRVSQEILNKLSEELKEDAAQEPSAEAAPEPVSQPAPEAATEPAPASNRTMSADEIAAAFAAAQQPAAAPEPAVQPALEAAPETAPASNRTMSADEIAAAFAAAQQPAAPESAPQPAPEAAPAPAPAEEPAPQPDTAADNPAPTKIMPHMVIPKSQISDNLTQDDYRFVNVMEQLILRQDIDNYLEQYNVCKCKRCVSDVCALALTGLPSKYVVSSKDSLPPILSYYESKFRIYMLTELIKACNKVRENPRHKK
ncbi:hypothetical protein D3Z51_13450 [Clostridiaceae bacterium]|nr:hypothetical protein [Clostridiaceae bacterium]RKI08042.1 hypothetical protein D7V81_19480 [bacterium 1XD21-70]